LLKPRTGLASALAFGALVSMTGPTALGADFGIPAHPAGKFVHIPGLADALQAVEANASIVNTPYCKYESLLPSNNGSSALPSAITNLISQLQSDAPASKNATSASQAQRTLQQLEQANCAGKIHCPRWNSKSPRVTPTSATIAASWRMPQTRPLHSFDSSGTSSTRWKPSCARLS